jgi:photosystem II stability/assembly factor-like uncharacterized protein
MIRLDRRRFAIGAGAALSACATPEPQVPATWRALPTEPYRGKQDDIVFINRDRGWYGNGAGNLYCTMDGGESWEKIWEQPGTFIRALGFLDDNNGFLGNVGTNYFPNVTDSHPLYRTRDGGVSWTPVQADGIGVVAGICGIDIARHRGMTIVTAAGRVGGPVTMMRSLDSGESWRVIDLSPHAGMILDVKFFDVMNGFVCAASSSSMAEANAAILRTTDGGETWSRVYQSNRPFENCWKMSWPTRQTGYASIQNYQDGVTQRFVAKTTDGGATWRELPLVDDAAVREFGIGFVDENWGWIGASTTGFETRNGGESWTPIDMGRAVNKVRVLRDGRRVRAYAIGAEVRRLDTAL